MKTMRILSFALIVLIGYLFYMVMRPFFVAAFWAIVFTIVFHPLYNWILKRLTKNTFAASMLTCLAVALFFIVPMGFLGTSIAKELHGIYKWAEANINNISPETFEKKFKFVPFITDYIRQYVDVSAKELQSMFVSAIKTIASFSASSVTVFLKNFLELIIDLGLAFFMMFYLLIESEKAIEFTKHFLPLTETEKSNLITRTRDVITATVNGGLIVGLIQGVLGGLAFWVLGLKAPVLWGFVMFILTSLPGIGSATIWGPASVYLILTGDTIAGIILLVWCAIVFGLADYVIRPLFLSEKTDLHPLLLFLSILGGVSQFGLIGIVAGPLLLSLAKASLDIYYERTLTQPPSD